MVVANPASVLPYLAAPAIGHAGPKLRLWLAAIGRGRGRRMKVLRGRWQF
jgi:hypothetical protein